MKVNTTIERMLSSRTVTGRSGKKFEGLGALTSINNLNILHNLCHDIKPRRTLEIGLCFGGSALTIASALRELGGDEPRLHSAIDPFQETVWDYVGLDNIAREGLSDVFRFLPASSSLQLPALVEAGERFDLIYVDGSHLFEDVFIDAYYGARLLADNGVLIFDDCTDCHVRKVIRFLERSVTGLASFDLAPYRRDRGRSARFRVARMIGRVQTRAFQRVGPIERPWNAQYRDF